MRLTPFALAAIVGILITSMPASANPIHAGLCCEHHKYYIPVNTSPSPSPFGATPTFGGIQTFGAVPSFGGVQTYGGIPSFGGVQTYGGIPSFGGVQTYGGIPSFGGVQTYGGVPTYGYMPLNNSGGFGSSNFGSANDQFGVGPLAAALLSHFASNAVSNLTGGFQSSRFNQPGTNPPTTSTAPAVSNAVLDEINRKLDAIIVNQAVSTTAILSTLKTQQDETKTKLDAVLSQLIAIKAKTDKIP